MNNGIRRKPGIKKALEFLIDGIDSGRFGTPLPSIRRLARNADVSFVTMWKAIGQLREAGGIGPFSAGRPAIQGPAAGADLFSFDKGMAGSDSDRDYPGALWLKLKAQIRKDILTGRFAPGEALPFIKELQYRYDVSFATIKKALESLESDDTIRSRERDTLSRHLPPPTATTASLPSDADGRMQKSGPTTRISSVSACLKPSVSRKKSASTLRYTSIRTAGSAIFTPLPGCPITSGMTRCSA